jgi:hypothetical protein
MDAEHESLVAGLFESQQQAEAAVEGLHRVGVDDAAVEIGAPEPGRYRTEYHESGEIGRVLLRGMAVGAVLGGVITTAVMAFVVPGLNLASLIALGVPMGAFWGVFIGGLSGMALKAATAGAGERQCAITAESPDVLVVVHAGNRFGIAHEAMERKHPRYFLTDVPAVHHAGPHLAATA